VQQRAQLDDGQRILELAINSASSSSEARANGAWPTSVSSPRT
jgi:hypothetical protein